MCTPYTSTLAVTLCSLAIFQMVLMHLYLLIKKIAAISNIVNIKAYILLYVSCFLSPGWLFKIELSKKDELDDLMDETGYNEFLKSQEEE